jgi:TolB protein
MKTTNGTTPHSASARMRNRRTSASRTRTSRTVIGVAAMLLIPAASAAATPPGQNGDIAFRRYLGPDRTNGAIFTIAPDGSGERQLTAPRAPLSDDFPDFAPDGSFIAFHRGREGGTNRILTIRRDGTGLRRVDRGCTGGELPPSCAEAAFPAIAPNGRRIAFVRYSGRIRDEQIDHEAIFTMRTDGSHLRRVTRPRSRVEVDTDPQWSPDGRKVVFLRVNLTATPRGKRAVFTVNADGSGLRRLTPWAMDAGDGPDWSPDGTRILFRSPETEDFLNSNLYTIRPDGTKLEQITHVSPTTRVYSASFSPDGTSITFGMTGVDDAADVFTMRLDGTALTPVTRTPLPDSAPDWGPRVTAAFAAP